MLSQEGQIVNKDFWIAVWSWLVTPVGAPSNSRHRRRRGDPKPGSFGHYKGRHRMCKLDTTPEAGAWFRGHQRDFASLYARTQGRAA